MLGDIRTVGSEVAYMVGPLRCHGDSKSVCMQIVSLVSCLVCYLTYICYQQSINKEQTGSSLAFNEVVWLYCSLPLEGGQTP